MGSAGQIDELAVRRKKMLGRQTRKASGHFTYGIRLQGFPSKMRDSGRSLSTRNTVAMECKKPPVVGGTFPGIYSLLPSGKSGPKLLPRLAASLSPTKGRMNEEGAIEYPSSPEKRRDEIAGSAIAGTPGKLESAANYRRRADVALNTKDREREECNPPKAELSAVATPGFARLSAGEGCLSPDAGFAPDEITRRARPPGGGR